MNTQQIDKDGDWLDRIYEETGLSTLKGWVPIEDEV
jgi:hypothetical protein